MAREQIDAGAAWLDVCATLEDGIVQERERLLWTLTVLRELSVPLIVDSADPTVLTSALEARAPVTVLNSISLRHGAAHAAPVIEAARDHGLALVALTIDLQGLAMTCARKVGVAGDLVATTRAAGLPLSSLWCDPLVLPVSSQPAAARQTVDAIRAIKGAWPDLTLVVGVSDISFGLPPSARSAMDRAFLHRCVEAGLDVALANPVRLCGDADPDDERLADAVVLTGDVQARDELVARHHRRSS